MEITFETLPKAVSLALEELDSIKKILLERPGQYSEQREELLTVQGAAEFLSLSVQTIYGLISKGELPVMKRGKRCYFDKAELMQYLKEGRKKTNSEISAEADQRIKNKKGSK